jgi:hypothetical protein
MGYWLFGYWLVAKAGVTMFSGKKMNQPMTNSQ